MQKRYGTPANFQVIRNVASGFNNQSGINITDSGQGKFTVSFFGTDTSGLDPGNFAASCVRVDSGFRTTLTEGYISITPSVG